MDGASQEKAFPEIEALLLDLARAYHWTGLYRPGHPFLEERIGTVHAALLSQAAREPSGKFHFGIARDRLLYQDVFLGGGKDLIGAFAEALYLQHVASIAFDAALSTTGLLAFFHGLRAGRSSPPPEGSGSFIDRHSVPGIVLLPYDYTGLFSPGADGSKETGDEAGRDDALWRMLLANDVADEELEKRIVREMEKYPELIPAILGGMERLDLPEDPGTRSVAVPGGRAVSGEVLGRIFCRIREVIQSLPPDRRTPVLAGLCAEDPFLESPPWEDRGGAGLSLSRALVRECPDEELVELLAAMITAERKDARRLTRIFGILAEGRDVEGSLVPQVERKTRESLRARDQLDLKTWETVESLLLSRSEASYVGEDHSLRLDALAQLPHPRGDGKDASVRSDPAIDAAFAEEGVRRAVVHVLLELLAAESGETEFFGLLEDFRKMIPNLISRKEVGLLSVVLSSLSALEGTIPPARRAAVASVAAVADFGGLVDHYLGSSTPPDDRDRIAALVSAHGSLAVSPLLERLLNQQETPRRKALLALAFRLGKEAVPEILKGLPSSQWYYVRNLCLILGEIGDRAAVPGLINALRHSDQRVKREAIHALGKIRASEAVAPLARILHGETFFSSQKEDTARIDAASALYRIGGTEALASLHRAKDVRRPAVRDHCRALLRRLGES
jgi:hypothetical protein